MSDDRGATMLNAVRSMRSLGDGSLKLAGVADERLRTAWADCGHSLRLRGDPKSTA